MDMCLMYGVIYCADGRHFQFHCCLPMHVHVAMEKCTFNDLRAHPECIARLRCIFKRQCMFDDTQRTRLAVRGVRHSGPIRNPKLVKRS